MRSTNQNGADGSDEHAHQPSARPRKVSIAPHWAAISGLVAIGVLYALLPTKITFGPSWLLLAVEGVFLLPFVIATLTNRRVSPVTLRVGSLIPVPADIGSEDLEHYNALLQSSLDRVKAFAEANVDRAGSDDLPFFQRHKKGGTFPAARITVPAED